MARAGLLFESLDLRCRFLVEAGRPAVVGRHPPRTSANVRVASRLAAREQVRISDGAGGFVVDDLGSAGGTFLDNRLLRGPTAIGPGQRLVLAPDLACTVRRFCGESLADRLGRRPLAPIEGVELARALLDRLVPLHDVGRPHGGLGPHTILRDEAGRFELLIHGWPAHGGGVFDGSLGVAPDVAAGGALTPAVDLYALGSIIYEALARRPAFPADTPGGNPGATPRGPAPIAEPGWPAALRDLLPRWLAPHPEARGRAADALAQLAAAAPPPSSGPG